MKYIYSLFILWGLTSCSLQEKLSYDLVISDVNLIDVVNAKEKNGVNIYMSDGKIVRIDEEEVLSGGNRIDGTGKYLIPGLFDCHIHTSNYQKDFPQFMHFGVTSIFITGGSKCTNEYYREMRQMGNQDSIPAPRVFHTSQHFTLKGRHPVKTYGSSNWQEGKSVYFLNDTAQIEKLVAEVATQPILGIKLTIEDGPHPPPVERIPQSFINKVQKEADKHQLEVYAHVSDNIELEMAIEAGIQNLVHFTGVDLDFENDRQLLEKIYQDSISWVTTLMLDKSFMYPLYPEWFEVSHITDLYSATELADMQTPGYKFRAEDYVSFFKEYLGIEEFTLKDAVEFQVNDIKELKKNGVNMVLGTDTGNDFIFPGYALHEEMQLLELGGMNPIEILKMGTINAAKMMKAETDLGSIEVGKKADMILLNKNPLESISNTLEIQAIIKNGVIQKRIQ